MKKMSNLVMVLLATTSFSWVQAKSNPTSGSATTAAPATTSNELKVGVKGMVCAFCAQGIEKKFKAQAEVEKIQVSLENKFVKLTFKDGQRLSNEKISALLKEAGYESDFGG